jgi:oxalate decarboxylase/phosphoglucose isomerase-like protein (cupin superfamily)
MVEVKIKRKVKEKEAFWNSKTIYFSVIAILIFSVLYFKIDKLKVQRSGREKIERYLNSASELESKGFYRDAVTSYEDYVKYNFQFLPAEETGKIYYKIARIYKNKLKDYHCAAQFAILAKNFLPS